MNDVFTLLLRVRYAECDAQQVVFNSRYGDYVDVAATEFMRAMGGLYDELMNQGFDNQVVKLVVEWKSSAKYDDVLAIKVACQHVGNTSYSLIVEFLDHATDRYVAKAEIIYVVVDGKTFEKCPVPEFFKEKLLLGAKGVVVNQAGVVI